jgi:hypothetical protein
MKVGRDKKGEKSGVCRKLVAKKQATSVQGR